VLCSLREMFGIVLLEATACGVPCLVHDHPVLKWVVGPGGTAIDMSARGTLAQMLQHTLTRPARLNEVAKLARQHCVESFSKDSVVNRIVAYYSFVYVHGCGRSRDRSSNRFVRISQ